jgi:hypothetical protein
MRLRERQDFAVVGCFLTQEGFLTHNLIGSNIARRLKSLVPFFRPDLKMRGYRTSRPFLCS